MHVEIHSVHSSLLYAGDVLQTHHSLKHYVSMLVETLFRSILEESVTAEHVIKLPYSRQKENQHRKVHSYTADKIILTSD